jgi:hypothetical protein
MIRALARAAVLAFCGLLVAAPAWPAGAYTGWAVVVAAGDDQSAHDDTPTQAFDNARRDVAAGLIRRGFSTREMAQFSLHPDRYPADGAAKTSFAAIRGRLGELARAAPDGCLFYLTSHGSPDGVVIDDVITPPGAVAAMIRRSCGDRPTAVIISACFSGVFLPALAGPNRLVMTAARRDRSSFGCGEDDRYPVFDMCVIQTLPGAADFIDLAARTRHCVEREEDLQNFRPRSHPQFFIGGRFRAAMKPFTARAG